MKIIIGADICITESNKDKFESADIDQLLGKELTQILRQADVRIFNLEGPLIDEDAPITKCGPALKMSEKSIAGLKALEVSLFGLANNHIMDHGTKGYTKTMELLAKAQIPSVGCGKNAEEASKPYIIEMNNKKIGVYACAEHEFTIVSEDMPGANPYDYLESFDHIYNLKQQCDYVIVLYHGGKEHYRYPSPDIQKIFRKMAQKGADLVVAQHTHCIGCFEEYMGSTLVYGQGNFIFDNMDNEYWNSGLLIEVDIENDKNRVNFIPFTKKSGGIIRIATEKETSELMNGFYNRSKQVVDDTFVKQEYSKYAASMFEEYLRIVHGNNFFFKVFNKLAGGGLVFKMYEGKNALVGLLNMIECEAHHELLITAIKNEYKKGKYRNG